MLIAAAAFAGAASVAQAQDTHIIVVSHGQASDAFWSVVKNGAAQAAKDYGVKVDYRAPETFDMVAMAQLIDAAVNQEPDGLIVSIPDADALGPSIKKAVAAGISVISMNSGSDVSKGLGALLHVGQEEFDAGKIAGEKLAALGGKKALCVNQEVGNVALDLRCAGFAEGFGGPVKVIPTTMDPGEISAKVRASIEADGDIDTILTLGASSVGEPAVADGKAAFAIDQQQYLQGYLPVAFLALQAKFGLMPGGNVPSGPNLITGEKAGQVVELSAKGIR
jgi:simple sugar transport system substrate-binding protein